MENQKLAKANKKKEVRKARLSKRLVCVTFGDLLQEKCECVCNSIGSPARAGFGGAIGGRIVKACGKEIIDECHDEACSVFNNTDGSIEIGKFVSTSACNADDIKFVLHCVCPAFDGDKSEKILTKLIKEVFEFCDKNKVESISVPPMSSGILGFPLKN